MTEAKRKGGPTEPPKLTRRIGRDGRVISWREEPWADYEWEVELEFTSVEGGALKPSRLELRPGMFYDSPPPEGITARFLRAIKLGELVNEFNQEYLDELAAGALFFGRDPEPAHDLPPPSNRPGPQGWGEVFYIDLARDYLEAAHIDPRRPLKVLARLYPGFAESTLRDCVHRARGKGYLETLGRGRSGGLPTEKLTEALRARVEAGKTTSPK